MQEENNWEAEPLYVWRQNLQAVGSGLPYAVHCPVCPQGLLLGSRDASTLQLNETERCTWCGQKFYYNDINELRAADPVLHVNGEVH